MLLIYKKVVDFIRTDAAMVCTYYEKNDAYSYSTEFIDKHKTMLACIITEAEWLISTELADYLKKNISNDKLLKEARNGSHIEAKDIWIPSKDFNDQFEKYLKLK